MTTRLPPPDGAAVEELVRDGDSWVLYPKQRPVRGASPASIVPALAKAIGVIAYINARQPAEATLAEIAEATGVTRSHCHAILKTLVHHDWLLFNGAVKSYRLHPGILRDISSVLHEGSQVARIRPVLEALCRRVGLPCVLSQPLADGTFVIVDKASAPGAMQISFPLGHRHPRDAWAQMRANLAWGPPAGIDRWLAGWQPRRSASRTPLEPELIRHEIAETRRRGYARSEGEFTEGLMTLAVPIFDRAGAVSLILYCSSTISTVAPREAAIAQDMLRATRDIHALLGSCPPETPPA